MDLEFAIGVLGILLILAAFIIEEIYKESRHESIIYNVLNLCGAAFLISYAWSLGSWPFLILNGVWLVVAAWKLITIIYNFRRHNRRQ